ncbi:hypothetical protein CYPRO_2312 [Cyclonatronum proteinivorum]|uniref:AB hydrolase-1 domain-containing protein n=1 Tax=Cyclonatronum proteinivorum TaxID=1457365 RepID=A0A345UM56_9BACT|nr:alpha/beta hydrolase [Cyclonatronum proteinivorum]AXJ01558.1 hypothetical protein CYPRO_2312 [Cyclonatronum proteinivorum]
MYHIPRFPAFSAFIISLALLTSCTTIEISERDAFDNHPTVTPQSYTSEHFTLTEYAVPTADGETLNAWHLKREDALGTVLYFGGNGFLLVKALPWIQAYEQLPVNLLLFDYRGYGLSTGSPSVEGLFTDARTMHTFLTSELGASPDRILLHGHSMGSLVAGRMLSELNPAGYIMESPISEVRDWTRRLVPWLLRPFIRLSFDEVITAQNNIDRVSASTAPALFITGTDDQITPMRMAKELHDVSASTVNTLYLVEGGGHNDLPTFDTYGEALLKFMTEVFETPAP